MGNTYKQNKVKDIIKQLTAGSIRLYIVISLAATLLIRYLCYVIQYFGLLNWDSVLQSVGFETNDKVLQILITQYSVTFILISLIAFLSAKGDYILWEDIIKLKLIEPPYSNFISLTTYAFSAMIFSTLFYFTKDYYMVIILFFLGIVILLIMVYTMTDIYYRRDKIFDKLDQQFKGSSLNKQLFYINKLSEITSGAVDNQDYDLVISNTAYLIDVIRKVCWDIDQLEETKHCSGDEVRNLRDYINKLEYLSELYIERPKLVEAILTKEKDFGRLECPAGINLGKLGRYRWYRKYVLKVFRRYLMSLTLKDRTELSYIDKKFCALSWFQKKFLQKCNYFKDTFSGRRTIYLMKEGESTNEEEIRIEQFDVLIRYLIEEKNEYFQHICRSLEYILTAVSYKSPLVYETMLNYFYRVIDQKFIQKSKFDFIENISLSLWKRLCNEDIAVNIRNQIMKSCFIDEYDSEYFWAKIFTYKQEFTEEQLKDICNKIRINHNFITMFKWIMKTEKYDCLETIVDFLIEEKINKIFCHEKLAFLSKLDLGPYYTRRLELSLKEIKKQIQFCDDNQLKVISRLLQEYQAYYDCNEAVVASLNYIMSKGEQGKLSS